MLVWCLVWSVRSLMRGILSLDHLRCGFWLFTFLFDGRSLNLNAMLYIATALCVKVEPRSNCNICTHISMFTTTNSFVVASSRVLPDTIFEFARFSWYLCCASMRVCKVRRPQQISPLFATPPPSPRSYLINQHSPYNTTYSLPQQHCPKYNLHSSYDIMHYCVVLPTTECAMRIRIYIL